MKILRILLFVGAAALLCSALPGNGVSPVSEKVNEYTAPIRKYGVNLMSKLGNTVDSLTGAKDIKSENEKLKEQLNLMGDAIRESEESKRRLAQLEEYLSISMRHEAITLSIPSEIISFIPNDINKSFIIDIGKEDGVEEYSPIISSDGLSGVAVNVSQRSCTVSPLTSAQVSVCVLSPISGASGAVCGSTNVIKGSLCRLICTEGNFREDEVLYTSGEGGLFPMGLPVGIVVKSSDGELFVKPLSKYSAGSLYYAVL